MIVVKRISCFIALVCALLMGTASCSDDAVDIDEYTKQTLFVYMPWSGSETSSGLYSYFQVNLDSIERAIKRDKGLDGTRVLVFISNSANQSSLYEITYQNGDIAHVPVNEYAGQDYATTAGLSGLLNEVVTYAPALNYAMIIGGHGCGWTYKEDWEDYPTRALELKNKMNPAAGLPMTRFFGSVADNKYAMNVEELAEAIESTGLKMQYVLFDDCYMANVETAYALRNATNFLVASTSEVMSLGMPYYSLWPYLASGTPNYANIVSGFNEFYSGYTVPCGALSAIDCRQMENLAAVMSEVNATAVFDESRRAEVQALDGFSPNLFYDLGSYVKTLDISNSLRLRFEAQLEATVRATQSTEYVYTALRGTDQMIKVDDYSGITISDISTHNVANKGKEKTEWWTASHQDIAVP